MTTKQTYTKIFFVDLFSIYNSSKQGLGVVGRGREQCPSTTELWKTTWQ